MVPNALKVLEKGGRLVMAVNGAEAARVYLRVIRSSLSRWEINLKQGFAFDVV